MKLEILGSGGAVKTPKPFCSCRVCTEAREGGVEYSRMGPSVFIHGPDILIDTPEEISIQINRSRIPGIRAGLYSHWHPDHTAGKRVFEMNIDWTGLPPKPACTSLILPEKIASTFEESMSIMQTFNYFEYLKIIDMTIIGNDEELSLDGYRITPVQLGFDYVFGYEIASPTQKILIIMDEMKDWKPADRIRSTHYDLVYLPFGIFDVNPITQKRLIDAAHPLLEDEQTVDETIAIIDMLTAKRFILSHIEEPDGITIELGRQLSDYYSRKTGKDITLASDTMLIEV